MFQGYRGVLKVMQRFVIVVKGARKDDLYSLEGYKVVLSLLLLRKNCQEYSYDTKG